MKSVAVRPGKRLVDEFRALILALIMPAVMVVLFPYSALNWKAEDRGGPRHSFCAFVTLSPEEEAAALEAARSAWRTDLKGVANLRADLSVAAIPEETREPVASRLPPSRQCGIVGAVDLTALPPSRAAGPAEKIVAERPDERGPGENRGFTRDELLKLD